MELTPTKLCRVCGDKALSFHFNGLTCSPCKMFFKRNAGKLKLSQHFLSRDQVSASWHLVCLNSQICPINSAKSRKSCSKCRLEKCFTIGMNIEGTKSIRGESSLEATQAISRKTHFTLLIEQIIDKQFHHKTDQETVQIMKSAQLKIPKNRKIPLLELSKSESASIREIQLASSTFPEERHLPVIGNVPSLLEAFHCFSLYVRPIVSYCKRIGAFKCLKQEDQLALLKPYYFECLASRFSFLYDPLTDGYPIIENESGSEARFLPMCLINDSKMLHVTEIHRKSKSELHVRMENDTTIRDLIMAQFLFRPFNTVSCGEFIRNQYFLYVYLLRRYLEVKYPNSTVALKKFTALMAHLETFSRCNYARELYSAIDSSTVSGVLMEVFSLPQ